MVGVKGFKRVVLGILILGLVVIFCGCEDNTKVNHEIRLIRIHIRANSNSDGDQAVKLKVRDSVNAYLTKMLEGITDFDTAIGMLKDRLSTVEDIADKTLLLHGYGYSCRARVNNEFFPTRVYEGVVVESGYYDALILELGEGVGDNWWCVIYPPLCYVGVSNGGEKVEYKSYFLEFFGKYFGK